MCQIPVMTDNISVICDGIIRKRNATRRKILWEERRGGGEGKIGEERIYCSSELPHLIKLCLVHKQIY